MPTLSFKAEIASNIVILGSSLSIVLSRFYVRVHLERQRFRLADYIILMGWIIMLVYCILNMLTFETGGFDTSNPTSSGLKILFISNFLFDMGVFFPKMSVLAFYWHLIPSAVFPRMRQMLYAVTAYVIIGFFVAFCLDMFWCLPISDNWHPDTFYKSVWYSVPVFRANYAFNFGADLMIFIVPFFLFKHLNLGRQQKLALIGVFSLGLITMLVSITRYVWEVYNLDIAAGNLLCAAEIACATIVVSLPHLRPLLRRPRPQDTASHLPPTSQQSTKMCSRDRLRQSRSISEGAIPYSLNSSSGGIDPQLF